MANRMAEARKEAVNLAVQMSLQLMHEQGFTEAFSALEKEAGVTYDSENPIAKEGLLGVAKRMMAEAKLAQMTDDKKKLRELCLGGEEGEGEAVHHLPEAVLEGIHTTNILCSKFLERTEPPMVVSGSADATISISQLGGKFFSHKCGGRGGVLSVAWHPTHPLLLAGFMDGSHCLFSVSFSKSSISLIQDFKLHDKYVARVEWLKSGKGFVTASYDKTIAFYLEQNKEEKEKKEEKEIPVFKLKKRFHLDRVPDALAIYPGGEREKKEEVVVGLREHHLLQVFSLEDGELSVREINMNPNKDDFVCFSAMDIQFDKDGAFCSVYSNKNRVFVYSWPTFNQVATLEGMLNMGDFPVCRHIWDPVHKCIYATSERDCKVYGFNPHSEKIVSVFDGSRAKIRNLDCNEKQGLLTCSYDKIMRVYSL